MNELTEHFKLSQIPDAEIGERIKATVYFFVYIYAFTYVLGITFKNIINTPLTELNQLWHELLHAQNEWEKSLCSEPQPTMSLSSNLQLKVKDLMSQPISDNYLLKPKQLTLLELTTKQTGKRSKPIGFK